MKNYISLRSLFNYNAPSNTNPIYERRSVEALQIDRRGSHRFANIDVTIFRKARLKRRCNSKILEDIYLHRRVYLFTNGYIDSDCRTIFLEKFRDRRLSIPIEFSTTLHLKKLFSFTISLIFLHYKFSIQSVVIYDRSKYCLSIIAHDIVLWTSI